MPRTQLAAVAAQIALLSAFAGMHAHMHSRALLPADSGRMCFPRSMHDGFQLGTGRESGWVSGSDPQHNPGLCCAAVLASAQIPEPNCNSNLYEGNEVWSSVPNFIGAGAGTFW